MKNVKIYRLVVMLWTLCTASVQADALNNQALSIDDVMNELNSASEAHESKPSATIDEAPAITLMESELSPSQQPIVTAAEDKRSRLIAEIEALAPQPDSLLKKLKALSK